MGILGIQDMKCIRIREIVQRTGRGETGSAKQSAEVLTSEPASGLSDIHSSNATK